MVVWLGGGGDNNDAAEGAEQNSKKFDPNDVECSVLMLSDMNDLCKQGESRIPSHCKEMCNYVTKMQDEDNSYTTGYTPPQGHNSEDCVKPQGVAAPEIKSTKIGQGEKYIYHLDLPTIEELNKNYVEGGFAPKVITVVEYILRGCDLKNGNCANLRGCPVPEGHGTGKIGSMNSWDLSHLSTAHANYLVKLIGGGCNMGAAETCGIENAQLNDGGASLFFQTPEIKYVSEADGSSVVCCLLLVCVLVVVDRYYPHCGSLSLSNIQH